ncbi:MAG: beta galactosidase jelly roll domain-containing protein [Chloroflexi bacterium]|nr:beta galactosidase jelly roll domain-containing protein [Chloroflexota bacterium]
MIVPFPEYPWPQMRRSDWLNLNGVWDFTFDPSLSGEARGLGQAEKLDREILVPFCPESRLSGIADTDFHPGVWYRRTFQVPDGWQGQRVLAHFGAIDYQAIVFINGTRAGSHIGGYTPFSLDITAWLQRGENVLTIFACDDTRSPLQPTGKQSDHYHSYACLYTRTTGIWQTVWLEPVPASYIASLRLTPDLPNSTLFIEAELGGAWSKGTLQAIALLYGAVVGKAELRYAGAHASGSIHLKEPAAWSPVSPTLYDLQLTLAPAGGAPDNVSSYFGLRSLGIQGYALRLNDQPLYQRLVLDQGFYPDGIYTAPSDDALRNDIVISKEMGFNGARLHQKVFDPRYLYWADKLGYLVWGEFPSWGLDLGQAKALEVFQLQWLEELRRDYNHPSLVGWCPFNETQADQNPEVLRNIYHLTKAFDRTRPVIDTSGYQHVETDIYDCHNYEQNPAAFAQLFAPFAEGGEPFINRPQLDVPYAGQPYFCSEYGGIWWNPGQTDGESWGYGGVAGRPRSEAEFLARYRALTEALLNHPRMCAFCYTQLTDVEQEVNGLYTYTRKRKFDPALLHAINSQPAAIEK